MSQIRDISGPQNRCIGAVYTTRQPGGPESGGTRIRSFATLALASCAFFGAFSDNHGIAKPVMTPVIRRVLLLVEVMKVSMAGVSLSMTLTRR